MKKMKSLVLAVFGLLCSLCVNAHSFEMDGVYYRIIGSSQKVAVSWKGDSYDAYSNEYSGSVTIPNTVTYKNTTYSVTDIDYRAFYNCTGLTSVTIPANVTKIWGGAFYNCTGLTSVTIPANVTEIVTDAFYGCTNLRIVYNNSSLDIALKAQNNGYVAYYAYAVLKEGDVIGYDGDFMFITRGETNYLVAYTGSESEISLPNNYKGETYQINDNAFSSNGNLTSVTIPDYVTSIGASAFSGCGNLKCIKLGNSIKTIGTSAFAYSGLKSITIPASVTSIGNQAFFYAQALNEVIFEDGDNELYLDSNKYSDGIGGGLFEDCPVYRVYIGRNLSLSNRNRPYENAPFYRHFSRTSSDLGIAIIGPKVTALPASLFNGCAKIETIISCIPAQDLFAIEYLSHTSEAVLYVPLNATETYTATEGWSRVGTIREYSESEGFFYHVTSEENASAAVVGYYGIKSSVTIPKGITILDKEYDVTSIGNYVFAGNTNIETVVVPNSVASIGNAAFCACSGMISVVIPNNVMSIGNQAFSGCLGLTSVEIPQSVTSIGSEAFQNCSNLTSVHISDLAAWCNVQFEDGDSNPSRGNAYLYLNGERIKDLVIPNGVTSISSYAFRPCPGLTSMVIPNSVTMIYNDALPRCNSFVCITSLSSTPPTLEYNLYGDNYRDLILYVPAGTKEAYSNANNWSRFKKIIELPEYGYELTVSDAGYATLYLDYATEIPEGVQVYTATEVDGSTLKMSLVEDVLPANTGVVVRAPKGTYTFTTHLTYAPAIEDNLFMGSAENEMVTVPSRKVAFVLSKVNGEVGMYPAKLTDGQFLNNANKAYLLLDGKNLGVFDEELDSSTGQLSNGFHFLFPETTGVESVKTETVKTNIYYDLQGRQVAQPTRGLYILNGKKVYVK